MSLFTRSSSHGILLADQSGDRILAYISYVSRSYAEVCAGQFEAAAESIAKSQAISQELFRIMNPSRFHSCNSATWTNKRFQSVKKLQSVAIINLNGENQH